MTGNACQKFSKNARKGARILFDGHGLNGFLPLRGTKSKSLHLRIQPPFLRSQPQAALTRQQNENKFLSVCNVQDRDLPLETIRISRKKY